VYANDDYGRSFFRELLPLLEPAPAFQGLYSERADTAHLHSLAREIANVRPDLLVWLGRPPRLRVVWDSIRAELPDMRVLCGDGCENGLVYQNVNGSFTGLYFVRFIDPEASDNDQLAAFQARYRSVTAMPATAEAVLTYDAVYAIGAALQDGASSRGDVRDFLTSLGRSRPPLQGLSGPIEFEDNGDMRRPYLLAEVTARGVVAVPVDGR
jgi:ABC-type branched-subunit amino acid transport system substrate-binding protein